MGKAKAAPTMIRDVGPLGFPFKTMDPFLFVAYHMDNYPAGDENLGVPARQLRGHAIGSDFNHPDGWSMYHGSDGVPGFPRHPHRGFETVTVVRQGLVDHADSLGCSGRFGGGDVQWMTAGAGICHSEMFPLLKSTEPNPMEAFQIWLNLPRSSKMDKPAFRMLWAEQIPRWEPSPGTTITLIAGSLAGAPSAPPPPPPASYAVAPEHDIGIALISVAPGAHLELPAALGGTAVTRNLYFFSGAKCKLDDRVLNEHARVEVDASQDLPIHNTGSGLIELLMLQGVPIGEPVVQHGPFVACDRQGIADAFAAYQKDEFGGWARWTSHAPMHQREETRFAKYAWDAEPDRPPAEAL